MHCGRVKINNRSNKQQKGRIAGGKNPTTQICSLEYYSWRIAHLRRRKKILFYGFTGRLKM